MNRGEIMGFRGLTLPPGASAPAQPVDNGEGLILSSDPYQEWWDYTLSGDQRMEVLQYYQNSSDSELLNNIRKDAAYNDIITTYPALRPKNANTLSDLDCFFLVWTTYRDNPNTTSFTKTLIQTVIPRKAEATYGDAGLYDIINDNSRDCSAKSGLSSLIKAIAKMIGALLIVALFPFAYPLKKIGNSLVNIFNNHKFWRSTYRILSTVGGCITGGLLGATLGSVIPFFGTTIGFVIGIVIGSGLGATIAAIFAKYTAKLLSRIFFHDTNPDKWKLTDEQKKDFQDRDGVQESTFSVSMKLAVQAMNAIDYEKRLIGSTARNQKKKLNHLLKNIKNGHFDIGLDNRIDMKDATDKDTLEALRTNNIFQEGNKRATKLNFPELQSSLSPSPSIW